MFNFILQILKLYFNYLVKYLNNQMHVYLKMEIKEKNFKKINVRDSNPTNPQLTRKASWVIICLVHKIPRPHDRTCAPIHMQIGPVHSPTDRLLFGQATLTLHCTMLPLYIHWPYTIGHLADQQQPSCAWYPMDHHVLFPHYLNPSSLAFLPFIHIQRKEKKL